MRMTAMGFSMLPLKPVQMAPSRGRLVDNVATWLDVKLRSVASRSEQIKEIESANTTLKTNRDIGISASRWSNLSAPSITDRPVAVSAGPVGSSTRISKLPGIDGAQRDRITHD